MKTYGNTTRSECPICTGPLGPSDWRIPFTRLAEPFVAAGGTVHALPLLDPDAPVYEWSTCTVCGSISLNPYDASQKEEYRQSDYPVRRARDEKAAANYAARFKAWIAPQLRASDRVFVEAACGHGPYMALARAARPAGGWARLVGLELSRPAVEHLRRTAPPTIEAYEVDLDETGALRSILADASADVVVFSEAFEHVERPRAALHGLASVLRPGGRLLFTAQATGGGLPIRPGEPIYTSRAGLCRVIDEAGLRALAIEVSSGRWKIVAERA